MLAIRQIPFPDRERDAVIASLLNTPFLPKMELDEPLRFEERRTVPKTALRITQSQNTWGEDQFAGKVLFDYGAGWVPEPITGRGVWLPGERVFLLRDAAAEATAHDQLRSAGLRPAAAYWTVNPKTMPRAVRQLLQAGWHVEADGKAFRRATHTRVEVSSGIDWFELRGDVDYGGRHGETAGPAGGAAPRRDHGAAGRRIVRHAAGGVADALRAASPNLGTREEDHLRFRQNQAGLLDALLAAQPEVQVDEVFERARQRLRDFKGVRAAPQPEGFRGAAARLSARGCRLDALPARVRFRRLPGRRYGRRQDGAGAGAVRRRGAWKGKGPSLVVAPKSLMFNWRMEAARFTPQSARAGAHRDRARHAR